MGGDPALVGLGACLIQSGRSGPNSLSTLGLLLLSLPAAQPAMLDIPMHQQSLWME